MMFIKPFETMSQCCVALEIILKFQSIDISTDIISKVFKKTYTCDIIDKFYKRAQVFPNMFPFEYISSHDDISIKINDAAADARPVIETQIQTCLTCNQLLILSTLIKGNLYRFSEPSKPCFVRKKLCKSCNNNYFLSFYKNVKNEKYFYKNFMANKYFSISNETIIEKLLLLSLNSDFMYKHASFKNYTASCNSLFNHFGTNNRG